MEVLAWWRKPEKIIEIDFNKEELFLIVAAFEAGHSSLSFEGIEKMYPKPDDASAADSSFGKIEQWLKLKIKKSKKKTPVFFHSEIKTINWVISECLDPHFTEPDPNFFSVEKNIKKYRKLQTKIREALFGTGPRRFKP